MGNVIQNEWHLPCWVQVYPTIDASIFVKQNFQDISKYVIRKRKKNAPRGTPETTYNFANSDKNVCR